MKNGCIIGVTINTSREMTVSAGSALEGQHSMLPLNYTTRDFIRLYSKIKFTDDPDECWEWIGSKDKYGYGRIGIGNLPILVHRLAYHIASGIDPTGFLVSHLCHNTSCCNPAHLYLIDIVERFWSKVDRSGNHPKGCWEWGASRIRKGYGSLGFKGKTCRSHRVAWELTYGEIPEGLHVLHSCDNPPCCNPNHLFLGTNLDNARDKEAKGRGNHSKGENHYAAKLTDKQVAEIRDKFNRGIRKSQLAREYKVSKVHINRIIKLEKRKP